MKHLESPDSLISELETAIQDRSPERRVEAMRRISDLFLSHAGHVTRAQVAVFDDVLIRLVQRVENEALAELGIRLAPLENAPYEVIRHLARHDDVTVAAPVLSGSQQLTDQDLVEIAQAKGQGHLLAISTRTRLAEPLTDVLVERGGQGVLRNVAGNPGASFSDLGFRTIARRAERDDVLAETVGSRIDVPEPVLRRLLETATEAVRTRILEAAPLEMRGGICRAVTAASRKIANESTIERDFTRAKEAVLRLHQHGELDESAVLEFAKAHKFEELVTSLSVLSTAPVELVDHLFQSIRDDGMIVVCKAAELKWLTVNAILAGRFSGRSVSPQDIQNAKTDFLKLTVATAQRVVRFWNVRETAARQAMRAPVGGRTSQ